MFARVAVVNYATYLLKVPFEVALASGDGHLGLVLGRHLGNGLVEVGDNFPNVAHD